MAADLMVPAQVRDRGASDKVHALIDYFKGGAYAAEKSAAEGYVTPQLARAHGWTPQHITAILDCRAKLDRKFAKPLFQDPGFFPKMELYEREAQRFKNA